MSISLNKEKLSLSKFVARDKFTTWIEQEVLVPDIKPDVMKIIKVEAIPFIETTEVSDGSIKISGTINYYILYRSMDGGVLKGINSEYPFAQTINASEVKMGMMLDVDVIARNVIYSLPNERKIMLKTELVFNYDVLDLIEVPVAINIQEGENIEYKMGTDTFNNVIDVKRESIDVSEEIVLPDEISQIEEIIKVTSEIKNTDYKVSYNKILVKGDLILRLMYAEQLDVSGVNTYNLTVPFAGMIEFQNISDSYKFDIKYTLQNLQVTLSSGESNVLNVQGAILARAIMYEEKDISHIADFYSTNKELIYDAINMPVIKNKTKVEKQIDIKERIGELDSGTKIIDYAVDTTSLSTSVTGGNLYISGSIKVPVMYENTNTNLIDSKTFEIVIENTIPLGKEVDFKNVDVVINKKNAQVVQSGNNIDTDITLEIEATLDNLDNITVVEDIMEQNINEEDFDSMYIYIVKKGDTLWDIAKKYKTTVSKIANVNNINDENKIDVGQKILLIR